MFKEIFQAFRAGHELDKAFEEFSEMLDHARWMFSRANAVLQRSAPAEEVRDPLYQRDQKINELLRTIRRRIVVHLTVIPGTDVAACLALMSIARDAERIGDYCKNVFEVGQFYGEDFHVDAYHEPLEAIRADVDRLFGEVQQAFKRSDADAAKATLRAADNVRSRCDDLIERLLADRSSIQTHEAVAYSLLARHYKRVAAHLANICTGISGKVEDLDFRRK